MSCEPLAAPTGIPDKAVSSLAFQSPMSLEASNRLNEEDLRLMVADTDWFLRRLCIPCSSNFQFQVDGVLYQASYQPEGKDIRLQLWAVLGYLPFSVESFQRRRMLLAILEGISTRLEVQFGIDATYQIIVTQSFRVSPIHLPEFIFTPIISFMQEARPFIQLIGECLI